MSFQHQPIKYLRTNKPLLLHDFLTKEEMVGEWILNTHTQCIFLAPFISWHEVEVAGIPPLFVSVPITSDTSTCQAGNTEENITCLTYFSLPFKDKTVEKKLAKCFRSAGYFPPSSNLQIKRLDHKKIKSSLWRTEHPVHTQIIKTSEKSLVKFPFRHLGGFFWETNVHWIGTGSVFDICHYLAPDDEGRPREARVPPSESSKLFNHFLLSP